MGLFDRLLFSKEQREWGVLKTTLVSAITSFMNFHANPSHVQNLCSILTTFFVDFSKHSNRTFSPEMLEDTANFFVALEMTSQSERQIFFDLIRLYDRYGATGKNSEEWRSTDKKLNQFFSKHGSKIGSKCF
jgi:hypothetical protein